jgi:hypothetical protein
MTNIVCASRDGVLRAPNGEQFRMVRGRTLADARHPAVVANPDAFMPVQVELSIEDADPGHLEDYFAVEQAELEEKLQQAEAEATAYRAQLVTIADIVMAAGRVSPGTDTDQPGWLAETIRTMAAHTHPTLATSDAEDDVPPPRTRAPRTPKPRA